MTRSALRTAGIAAGLASISLAVPSAASAGVLTISLAPLSPVEGQAFTSLLARVTDSVNTDIASDFTASVQWGDGVTSPATVSGAGASWSVTGGPHTYAEEGTYTIQVTVTDSASATSVNTSGTLQVADAPLSAPSGAPLSFSGAGTSGAATSMAAFRAAIGGADNGTTAGEQPGGFRHINWDGLPVDGTAPGSTVVNAHTAILGASAAQPFGLELASPLAIANDGFQSVNAGLAGNIVAFSAANAAAPASSNQIVLDVVSPASAASTGVPQGTRGIGAMFLNVRNFGATTIDFMSGAAVLQSVIVPVAGAKNPSFVGELFPTAAVTSVRITLGGAQIFLFDGTFVSAGPADNASTSNLVGLDDVLVAEPAALDSGIAGTAGIPLTGALTAFQDTDANAAAKDFTAQIDWGDGSRSSATIAANASGSFAVSGGHAFAQAGSFPVVVTVADLGGAGWTSRFTATIAPRSTATRVSCTPASIAVAQATTCTATVTDGAGGTVSAPTGTVAFTASAGLGGFGAGCRLTAGAVAGQSSCRVTYAAAAAAPSRRGLTAAYTGDAAHAASAGAASVTVRPPGCSLAVVSTKLGGRTPKLRVRVRCDQRFAVRLAVLATIARKGSHRSARLTFGSARGSASANTTLSIRPSGSVLTRLRAAAKNHQRISLSLTLTATASSRATAKASFGSLKLS